MRVRPVGARAVLLEVDGPDGVTALQAAVARLVVQGRLDPPGEVVPGARTLLLDGVDPTGAARLLAAVDLTSAPRPAPGPLVEVPTSYDGEDLGEVARLWGVSEREVVARHTGTEFRVAFCGFAPGFPYLVGGGEDVPRRASPRARVPAGSVALAGRYCGIYPSASPGGWQLLGTTDVRLFDAERDPPALLPPGTRVRFVETAGRRRPAAAPAPVRSPLPAARALTVLRPGLLTTVQDGGRVGRAHLGVPRAGPLDRASARLANRLVGNDEGAALLETTLDGCALRAGAALTVAVTGAPADVRAGGRAADQGVAVGLAAGDVLDVGPALRGVRSYVAVAGGLAVPPVLGSRATDTLAGLGPPPLAAGQVLPVGAARALPPGVDVTLPTNVAEPVVLRLQPGPRADELAEAGLRALAAGPWTLSPLSDRVGARLVGPPVPRLRTAELDSEGMVLGAVQVPPGGAPVVLLADHGTTGGYPVVGVVMTADLDALAQARPGSRVRLTLVGAGWDR